MKKTFLYQVLGAILLGVLAGLFTGTTTEVGGVALVRIFDLLGSLFLNSLKLIVVPLVAASIITGAARVGADHSFNVLARSGRTNTQALHEILDTLASWTSTLVGRKRLRQAIRASYRAPTDLR